MPRPLPSTRKPPVPPPEMPMHNMVLEIEKPPEAPAAPQVVQRVETTSPSTPAVFWGNDLSFPNIAYPKLGFLWALCALKVAYTDSDVVYADFKEKVGASDVTMTQVGTDPRVPKIMRVDYQDDVIFVLRGATRSDQWNLFNGQRVELARLTGQWMQTTTQIGSVAEQRDIGGIYSPFATLGGPIFSHILNAIDVTGNQKRVHFVGHSLGAAILDLIVMRMAKALHDRLCWTHSDTATIEGDDALTTTAALNAFAMKFRDRYNFGYMIAEPFLGRYMRKYFGRDASTGARVPMDVGGHNRTSEHWPWPYFTRRTAHLRHVYDPITYLPNEQSERVSELLQYWANPLHGPLYRYSQQYNPLFRMEDEERQLSPIAVTWGNREKILERANRYHTAGQLLRMYSNGLLNHERGAPSVWTQFAEWALLLGGDTIAPYQ